jgi:hypothetical protein
MVSRIFELSLVAIHLRQNNLTFVAISRASRLIQSINKPTTLHNFNCGIFRHVNFVAMFSGRASNGIKKIRQGFVILDFSIASL